MARDRAGIEQALAKVRTAAGELRKVAEDGPDHPDMDAAVLAAYLEPEDWRMIVEVWRICGDSLRDDVECGTMTNVKTAILRNAIYELADYIGRLGELEHLRWSHESEPGAPEPAPAA